MNCPRCNYPINKGIVWSNCPKCNCRLDRDAAPAQRVKVPQSETPSASATRYVYSSSTNHFENEYQPRRVAEQKQPKIAYCINCGQKIEEGDNYCFQCGSVIFNTDSNHSFSDYENHSQNNYNQQTKYKSMRYKSSEFFNAVKGIRALFISETLFLIYYFSSILLHILLITLLDDAAYDSTSSAKYDSIETILIIIAIICLLGYIMAHMFSFIGTIQLSKDIRITKFVYILLILNPTAFILSALLFNNHFLSCFLSIISFSVDIGFSMIIILSIIQSTQMFRNEPIFRSKYTVMIILLVLCSVLITLRIISYSTLSEMYSSMSNVLDIVSSITSYLRKIIILSIFCNFVYVIKNFYFLMFLYKAKKYLTI